MGWWNLCKSLKIGTFFWVKLLKKWNLIKWSGCWNLPPTIRHSRVCQFLFVLFPSCSFVLLLLLLLLLLFLIWHGCYFCLFWVMSFKCLFTIFSFVSFYFLFFVSFSPFFFIKLFYFSKVAFIFYLQFFLNFVSAMCFRRMFPSPQISIKGLESNTKYFVLFDIVPADDNRYKFHHFNWVIAGKAEPLPPSRTYIHPESPLSGSQWMKQKISFNKVKLTNNTCDQLGHVRYHLSSNIFSLINLI